MENNFAPAGMEIDTAEEVTSVLQERLADLIDLSLTLKHVHWNVVGVGFIAIHELMDQQTEVLRDLVDEVAERITTLGGIATGLTDQVSQMRTSDADYALGRGPVIAHLGALDKAYSRVISGHRDGISSAGDQDMVTQDLLIGQTAKLDLNHWFIRAHLEDTEGKLATDGMSDELEAAAAGANLLQPDSETEDVDELVPLT